MKVPAAIAEILKREGVEILFGYPRNAVLEAAAKADIRTVTVRQERTGVHMADAYSRMNRGNAGSNPPASKTSSNNAHIDIQERRSAAAS